VHFASQITGRLRNAIQASASAACLPSCMPPHHGGGGTPKGATEKLTANFKRWPLVRASTSAAEEPLTPGNLQRPRSSAPSSARQERMLPQRLRRERPSRRRTTTMPDRLSPSSGRRPRPALHRGSCRLRWRSSSRCSWRCSCSWLQCSCSCASSWGAGERTPQAGGSPHRRRWTSRLRPQTRPRRPTWSSRASSGRTASRAAPRARSPRTRRC